MQRTIALVALAIILPGCASLAVRPCDSIATRDSKYAARFFLGIVTLGISEAGIRHEQFREAREGWRFCPPPVAWQGPPPGVGAPRTPGMLVNATRWTINVYLDVEPIVAGIPPLLTLRSGESRRLALVTGQHRIVAMPVRKIITETAPTRRYKRQIQINPSDRHFQLRLSEEDFK